MVKSSWLSDSASAVPGVAGRQQVAPRKKPWRRLMDVQLREKLPGGTPGVVTTGEAQVRAGSRRRRGRFIVVVVVVVLLRECEFGGCLGWSGGG